MGNPRFSDGDTFPASAWSSVMDAIENQSVRMLGRGILSGIEATPGGGFDLDVSSGWVNALRAVEVPAFTYTLPPSVIRFVWVDPETSTVTLTATSAYPGGQVLCICKVETDGSGIDTITDEGRMLAWNWEDERVLRFGLTALVLDNLNNWVGIGTAPTVPFESAHALRSPGVDLIEQASAPAPAEGVVNLFAKPVDIDGVEEAEPFFQHESAGEIQLYVGAHQLKPVNVESLTGDKQLTARDANIQRFDGGASDRTIVLPPADTIGFGHWFQIHNDGATNDLLLETAGGTSVATIAPGEFGAIDSIGDGGVPAWPSTISAASEPPPGLEPP